MVKLTNLDISRLFYEIAEMLDIIGENRFKSAAYRRVAKALEALPIDVKEVYKKSGIEGLEGIPGVGEAIAEKLQQLITTGKLDYYDKLKSKIPSQVGALMKVPGLGPKKIMRLSKELGIKSLAQLEKAAKEHKIRKLMGFGEESEGDILDAIYLAKKAKGRMPLKEAEKYANEIVSAVKKADSNIERIVVAGSIRRKKLSIGDIDIVASTKNPKKILDAFISLKNVDKILARGETKATVMLKSGIQADLRVFKPESWGAGLLYFTGNKAYNIHLRTIAIKKGYKLNEYGLFEKSTGKIIAGKTEEEIFKRLGQKYLKPEEREK